MLTVAALLAVLVPSGTDAGSGGRAFAQSPLSRQAPPPTAPPLPQPSADASGAYVGDVLYVHAGGRAASARTGAGSAGAALFALAPGAASWTTVWTGRAARGAVLVSDGEDLYRVGGAAVTGDRAARPDLERWHWDDERWIGLTPMPSARTDHGAVVVGRRLWVVGGWAPSVVDERLGARLRTPAVPAEDWRDRVLVADLDAQPVSWSVVETASLRMHSLSAAVHGDAVWVVGGMTPAGPVLEAHRLDPRSGTLSAAPAPPVRGRSRGVGLGLTTSGGHLYASDVSQLFRLGEDGEAWVTLAYDIEPSRAYSELVGGPEALHIVGGASRGRSHALVDRVASAALRPSDVVDPLRQPAGAGADRPALAGARRWPGFRGPAFGHSQARDLPASWSDEHNVAWRHAVGGYGQSSPVVWDGLVFVTAIDGAQRETQIVEAVDLESGALQWRHSLPSSQPVEVTNFVAKGAPTPWVDGERVYYLFESGDFGALGHDGQPVWSRSLKADYGAIEGYGLGSSLAANGEALFLLAAHDGPSYLLAIDPATGETRWKADRPARSSWTTPIVVPGDDGQLVVVSIDGMVEAYAAGSGERVWWLDGLSGNSLPSPVLAGEQIVVPSMDSRSNLAIPAGRQGQLLDEQVLWHGQSVSASMSSPVATGAAVYFTNSRGVMRSLELGSGQSRWATRLASAAWATPIVNGDRLYVFGTNGVASIFAADAAEPMELGRNSLTVSDRLYGVAAIDGALLVRTGRELIRVGLGSAPHP